MKNILNRLAKIIENKKNSKIYTKENSYIFYLFSKGDDYILKKIGEEIVEVVIAAKNSRIKNNNYELIYECCDLIFHFMVMLSQFNIKNNDLYNELLRRENKSGLKEKLERLLK